MTTEIWNLLGFPLYKYIENFVSVGDNSQLKVKLIINLLGRDLEYTNKRLNLTEQIVLQYPAPENYDLSKTIILDLFG